GFKDVINEWKADKWDPHHLVGLYKRAGAQYFFAMGNHHDNLDMWDSQYQPWNSVSVGPKKDLIAGWAKAARENGLPFGISLHASHAWTWLETSRWSDAEGSFKGIKYDGALTRADGKGQWWDGLDPQDLYAQNHPASSRPDPKTYSQWAGGTDPAHMPDQAYLEKFYNRTVDLINKYRPELMYFDDDILPFWNVSDIGLKIAAHFYNSNMSLHNGRLEAVLFGKSLNEQQRKCMVWDIERGLSPRIEPFPWQTDTCIGGWHYNRKLFDEHRYKTATEVIHMLADIVSKNGSLMLNIPLRGDGTLDEDELKVIEGITGWMDINKEAIFGTRPWKISGEGPAFEAAAPVEGAGFNEGKGKPYTAQDVRFTQKGADVYAIVLGAPTEPQTIKTLGFAAKLLEKRISAIQLLGSEESVNWKQADDGLTLQPPLRKPSEIALVYKIS
ncbi:MAG: alpha-L-fucosidase, partial [Burkholderiales bacterium]|nr:alpha-L-fucosidase [Phycisphaerae bacterium]